MVHRHNHLNLKDLCEKNFVAIMTTNATAKNAT